MPIDFVLLYYDLLSSPSLPACTEQFDIQLFFFLPILIWAVRGLAFGVQ